MLQRKRIDMFEIQTHPLLLLLKLLVPLEGGLLFLRW